MNIDTSKRQFLIKSENLEKLREQFIKARDIILEAVSKKRLIIIKHHDDVDGYSSGIVLEKAISSLIHDERKYYYLNRSLSRAPYYDYIDALRDLSNHLGGYKHVAPLIILCDLGSNDQSIKSIKRLKDYGFDFIIIDHHKFDQKNKDEAVCFLNPHDVGLDSNLCAGTLVTELALFLNPVLSNIKHIPALSSVADKSRSDDVDEYIKISGYTFEELLKWGIVIDHETYYLKFQVKDGFFNDLFFPTNLNRIIVNRMSLDIENEFTNIKKAVKKYSEVKIIGNFKLITVSKTKIGDWDYASSKIIRIAHELFEGPRITLDIGEDFISYRCDEVIFSGPSLIAELKEKFPYALVNGGGHDAAGSIRFNKSSKDEIFSYILSYLEKL